jgi:phospholipid/cholesterol/gamma-HCH transport system substrate-binding protein
MERNANYALVGLSTIILFIGLAAFAVWLAQSVFGQRHDEYRVLFRGPVNGLSTGGEVHFNGIKVGEVRRIILDPRDPRNVIAYVSIDASIPVREDSYATLEPMGITGVNFIQITAGTSTRRLLKNVPRTDTREPPLIRSQSSALSDLLAGGGTVLTRATEALDRINRILSDENIRTLTATMSDVQAVTAELRARRAIFADAQHAIQSADQAAQQVRALAASGQSLVDGDGRRITARLVTAAEEIEGTARDVRAMVNRLSGPTGDFAATGLPQLQAAIVSLQQAADTMNRLASEIEQNPRGLVTRPPAQEVEVPQ